MKLEIRLAEFGSAEYDASRRLRDDVLRKPLGLRLDAADVAGEEHQLHLLAFDGAELIGCLVLVSGALAPGALASGAAAPGATVAGEERLIKMRQVAVAAERRGVGVGTALVRAAEALALERGFIAMTLHARLGAVAFYERLGYAREGEIFSEVTLPHVRMLKQLRGLALTQRRP